MNQKNKLYIVPTPIGNLKDITLRALEILHQVDYILAEDTRTSGVLLKQFKIEKSMRAFHMHNEHHFSEQVIQELHAGKNIALISDAGTPGINDPAYFLINKCIENNIEVECLPGATALIPALVCSGFPLNEFLFLGFPPQKKGRKTFFERLKDEKRTLALYESPHRIKKTIENLLEHFSADTPCVIAREISKKFETYHRGTLEELKKLLETKELKGEMVVVFSPS